MCLSNALEASVKDNDILVAEEIEKKKKYLGSVAELFDEMDVDGAGFISMQEFEAKFDDERVIAYFKLLKLDVSDAKALFRILDYDHSDEVGIDEFIDGCHKLHGESRTLDMKIMQYQIHGLQESFQRFGRSLKEIKQIVCCSLANTVEVN